MNENIIRTIHKIEDHFVDIYDDIAEIRKLINDLRIEGMKD